jgi:putative membrane protein
VTGTLARLLSPPAVGAAVAAFLFVRGSRRHMRVVAPLRRPGLRLRAVWFYAALATIVLALDSPVDDAAGRLFWVHMLQHVLLIMVAAPLLVMAAPWIPLWRGLPLGFRRDLAYGWVHSPVRRALRATGRLRAWPLIAFALFNVVLCAWHVPALFDLTLRSPVAHDFEHVSFLVLAVLFWAQVIESPPMRARLDMIWRIIYVTLGATVAWLLSVVLAFAPSPLYPAYVDAHAHSGGLSALGDQQLAAGIMWGPGSIPYALFVFTALYRWLAPATRGAAGGHWAPTP